MEQSAEFAVDACSRCPALVESRSRIVNGTGPLDATLLFVGEAPGEVEDREGEPFVGQSGDRLDAALADHGLSRDAVRITNAVKCRPPENRDPRVGERANCRPYLDAEIAAVDPAAIVTMGKVPSEGLLDRSIAVTKEAGTEATITVRGEPYRVLIGLHPAATMYDPSTEEPFEAVIAAAAAIARGER